MMIITAKYYLLVHRNDINNGNENILQTKLYGHLHILKSCIFFIDSPRNKDAAMGYSKGEVQCTTAHRSFRFENN